MPTINARNPRTGECDYTFEALDADSIASICREVRDAQQHWWSAGFDYRQRALSRWADEVRKRQDDIVNALAQDTGRRAISHEEVGVIAHLIEGYCAVAPEVLAAPEGRSSSNAEISFENQYVPYPVVGVISPWNFPLVLSLLDAIPALVAGCGAVIKPSEVTPRFIDPLMQSIEAVPELAAVLRYVKGGGDTGRAMIDQVDAVVFTGSIETGIKVAQAAAGNLIPAFLELGGKDPAVVLNGADLDRAATAILRSAIYNAGQVCYAIERVYVDRSVHDELVAKLVEGAQSLSLNYPDIRKGQVGPFIFAKQADIIESQLEEARAKGATVLTGGVLERHEGGVWLPPTVVTQVNHDMRLMTEETFGPVVPVMAFDSEEQAVALANDTRYGLSGAVFAESITQGAELARRIDAGGISINDTELPRTISLDGEKMAFKKSGMGGSRYGARSMLRYTRKKAIIKNPGSINALDALSEQQVT
ncbi:aldehyde dehydrogenase family protein [Kineobactrum salinum]|uniref:Aldehyde dehydrogenase family protein n=1 Tax=Kineobactrum salinum TaxID=2708301 RepID=A0A6C0U4Z8_9GAMM|nr:aldehyde dehydrogenase family protein [Kineobactrum salinum]QIB67066.1 aldehyde dehydrogenase family protein [Kineobactrum salinum]